MKLKLGDNSIDHVHIQTDLCKLITIDNNIIHADLESMYTPRSPEHYDYSLSNEDLTVSDYKVISDTSKEAYGIILYNVMLQNSSQSEIHIYFTVDIGSGYVNNNLAHIWIEIKQSFFKHKLSSSTLTSKYTFSNGQEGEEQFSTVIGNPVPFMNTCIFITDDLKIRYINNINTEIYGNVPLAGLADISSEIPNIDRIQLNNQNSASTRKVQFKPEGKYSINDINSSYRIYYL